MTNIVKIYLFILLLFLRLPAASYKMDSLSVKNHRSFHLSELILHNNDTGSQDTIRLTSNLSLRPDAGGALRLAIARYYQKMGILDFQVDSVAYKVTPVNKDSNQVDAHVFLRPGQPVHITGISFTGNKHVASAFLKKNIRVKLPFIYNDADIRKYKFELERLDYIRVSDSLYFAPADSGYTIIFKIIEGTLINFDFVVGYQQADKNKKNSSSQTSGHVLLNFRNLFGNGRKFRLEWDKPSTFSEKLDVRYREPFILNLPLHLEGNYERQIQDSLFNSSLTGIRGILPVSDMEFEFFYESRSSSVDSTVVPGKYLQKIKGQASGLTIRYDRLNNAINAQSGFSMDFSVASGTLKSLRKDTLKQKQSHVRLSADIQAAFRIKYPFAFAIHSHYFNTMSSENVPVVEKKFVGGALSVRGFREQQFLSEHFFWQRNELRFMLSQYSRMHFFVDSGFLFDAHQTLKSYGIGFLLPIKIGILQVDYGLTGGTNFNQGTLHFRLVNEF